MLALTSLKRLQTDVIDLWQIHRPDLLAHPAEVAAISAAFPASLEMWIEIPSAADPAPLLASIKAAGRGAKIRTGGVTGDAFPPAADIARFLAGCHGAGVVCKATAGLHHPLRAEYRLTDESDSPSGPMFGWVSRPCSLRCWL